MLCWSKHLFGILIFAIALACAFSGCTLGPDQIDAGRMKYNEAIQRTFQEEMLLNLIRLKYRDMPEFVAVGGVAAQYTWDGGATLGADFVEAGPAALGLSGAVKREERPTISYAPQRSADFNRGLLSPISVETLALLARTGWAWDRILRSTVQNINQVDNATSAGGPTPDIKPDFEEFRYLTQIFRELQRRHAVEIAQAERDKIKDVPVALEQLDGDFILGALDGGYKFKKQDGVWRLCREEQYAALIFAPQVLGSPEYCEIVRILGLQPGLTVYEVELARDGQIQGASGGIADLGGPERLPPVTVSGSRKEVAISTRSLLETMYYLSQGIQIPAEHWQNGLVTWTVDYEGQSFDWTAMTGDLLQVFVAKHKPKCAAVAVPYRGYWYYIDDRDLNSQSTFALLLQLFSIEIRGGGGSRLPVLTLGI